MRGVAKGESTAAKLKKVNALLRRYELNPGEAFPTTIDALMAHKAKLLAERDRERRLEREARDRSKQTSEEGSNG